MLKKGQGFMENYLEDSVFYDIAFSKYNEIIKVSCKILSVKASVSKIISAWCMKENVK